MLYPKITIENNNGTNLLNLLGKSSSICATLNQLIIRCNTNTFHVTSSNQDIEEMSNHLEVSTFTIRKNIKQLVDLEILRRIGNGRYKINQFLIHLDFKKGTWVN